MEFGQLLVEIMEVVERQMEFSLLLPNSIQQLRHSLSESDSLSTPSSKYNMTEGLAYQYESVT